MPLPVTDAPQGSQVWPRCYQKCLKLSDTNWLITPALITRSRRPKTKLPHWKGCGLGQTSCGGKPRSFVTGPLSLSARFATTWRSAPSQPRTCTVHWSNLYGSVHVLLWRTPSTRVYARAASRVWSAYRPLRSFVTSSTRLRLATFARAECVRFEFQTREDRHEYAITAIAISAQFAPSEVADILKRIAKICRAPEMANTRVIDLFPRCDPTFVFHRVEPTDQGPDRSRAFEASLLGARPAPTREHVIVSVCSAFAA